MKFIDEMIITLNAGRGGNGCMSFRREKFLPNGGPDGGNGGKGGSIILIASSNIQTLSDLEMNRTYSAENGEHGSGAQKNGRAGRDMTLQVPCGTIITDIETGEGLADLVEPGDQYLAAIGGRGGRGNRVFASSQRRAPRFSEKGEIGETACVRLSLKLIADVGLVGLPNAGKSSILAALSNASPKIAPYPFTTLSPNLGVLRDDVQSTIIADIPGLIEGAGDDKGLGLRFLRHIERTRLLVHVLDVSSNDVDAVINDYRIIRAEMNNFDPELSDRPCIAVANKIDLIDDEDRAALMEHLESALLLEGIELISISAATGENVDALGRRISRFAMDHPRPVGHTRLFATVRVDEESEVVPRRNRRQLQIISLPDGSFKILHDQIEHAADRYDLSQPENVARFTKLLRKYKVEEMLEACGAEPGAQVSIGHMAFDFYPDDILS